MEPANMFGSLLHEALAAAEHAVEIEDVAFRGPQDDVEIGFGASKDLGQLIQAYALGDVVVSEIHRRLEERLLLGGEGLLTN